MLYVVFDINWIAILLNALKRFLYYSWWWSIIKYDYQSGNLPFACKHPEKKRKKKQQQQQHTHTHAWPLHQLSIALLLWVIMKTHVWPVHWWKEWNIHVEWRWCELREYTIMVISSFRFVFLLFTSSAHHLLFQQQYPPEKSQWQSL